MKQKKGKKRGSFVLRKQKSFTLIELMIVIAIIIILAGIAIPTYLNLTNKAKVAVLKSNMGVLATVLETYRTDWGLYPSSTDVTGLAQWVAIDDKTGIFYQELTGGLSAKINTKGSLTAQKREASLELAKTYIYSKPLAVKVVFTKVSSFGNTSQQYISGVTLDSMSDPFKASEDILKDGHIYYKSADGNSWYLVAYTGLTPELYLLRSNTASEVMGGTLVLVLQEYDLNVTEDNIYKMKDINDVPENTPVIPPDLEDLSAFKGFPAGSPLGSLATHITSPFGIRSDVGTNLDFHLGIDLSTDGVSQPIYATLNGIIKIGTTINGGNVIEIWSSYDGTDGKKYFVRVRLCHTASSVLNDGEEVKVGDLVGYSGNSGTPFEGMGSTYAYHLHYEIRIAATFADLMDGRKSAKNPLTGGFGLEVIPVED